MVVMLFVTSISCCVGTTLIYSQIHSKFMLLLTHSFHSGFCSIPRAVVFLGKSSICAAAVVAVFPGVPLAWQVLNGQGVGLFPQLLCRINQTLPFLCFVGFSIF